MGQAAGAIAAGTLGGAVRIATGAASGAAAAILGLRTARVAETPQLMMAETPPTRPRALEEYDLSEAGSQEITSAAAAAETVVGNSVMARVRELERQLAQSKAENDLLKQRVERNYSTPSPEQFSQQTAQEETPQQE